MRFEADAGGQVPPEGEPTGGVPTGGVPAGGVPAGGSVSSAGGSVSSAASCGDVGFLPVARRRDALAELIDRIAETDRTLASVAARRAELVEAARTLALSDADDHDRNPVSSSGWSAATVARRELTSELACALHISQRAADVLVEDSRAIVRCLPGTHAALSAGEISHAHARKLVEHARSLPDEAWTSFEQAALPDALRYQVAKFDRKARVIRERTHPESIAVRSTIAREQRDMRFEAARDGMAWLTAYAPAELALAAYHRVTDIAVGLKSAEEPRTLPQLRADVLCDLLIDGTTTGRGIELAASAAEEGVEPDDVEVLRCLQGQLLEHDGILRSLAELDAATKEATEEATKGWRGSAVTRTPQLDGSGPDTSASNPSASDAYASNASVPHTSASNASAPHASASNASASDTAASDTSAVNAAGPGVTDPYTSDPVPRQHVPRLGHGIRAKVLVEVPVLTLLEHDDDPATLEGYGPIDPDVARRLAANAPSFTRILTHPETGAVLSVGRDSYAVPADLRTWLRVRDGTCRFPGCEAAPVRCEIDHGRDWALGGLTEHDNLAHLCASHHHLKHHTSWTVEHEEYGELDWRSPLGAHYRTSPERAMRPTVVFRWRWSADRRVR